MIFIRHINKIKHDFDLASDGLHIIDLLHSKLLFDDSQISFMHFTAYNTIRTTEDTNMRHKGK